jgi:MoxR-like ATPase
MSSPLSAPTVLERVRGQVSRSVVGQPELIEQMLVTVACEGHSLLEGVAGLGKWLAVQSLAQCLGLAARKVRCSPDLDVESIAGLSLDQLNADDQSSPAAGPLSGNLVLVDQIDRLSPRVENLIQQAMQEHRLSEHVKLPEPFVVFATRRPSVEQQPQREEFHDDRFLLKIAITYPPYHDEYRLSQTSFVSSPADIEQVISRDELSSISAQVKAAEAAPSVVHYAVRIVRATRVHEGENLDFIYEWVQQGAGPRATDSLMLAANARAILHGRLAATHEDVAAMAFPTLRHRIATNRNAQENGIPVDRVIQRLLEDVPPRIIGDDQPPRAGEAFSVHNWEAREE